MFAARSIRPVASVARTQVAQQQSAGMATLKELDQRLKSVRNIEKITKVSVTSSWAVDLIGCLDWMGGNNTDGFKEQTRSGDIEWPEELGMEFVCMNKEGHGESIGRGLRQNRSLQTLTHSP
jgi:hypothetical protein